METATNVIEKIMSLAEHEFIKGCQRLAGDGDTVTEHDARISVGGGVVDIAYRPLDGVRLGGLLELPRAKVTLTYSDAVSSEDRDQFLRRFDLAFQRGGG